MQLKSLSDYIIALDNAGELIRVKNTVNPYLEIAEITDRIVKSNLNKALLFEDTGTAFPLLINAYGSEKRMCMALQTKSFDSIGKQIESVFKKITQGQTGFIEKLKLLSELREIKSWMPVKTDKRGKCQQVVMPQPDLAKLPILTCWPYDGGPFITLPVVHTKHPETGLQNAGMYRMQVYDARTTGMHWHLHKDSARHFNAWKKKGGRMPVSVVLGGHPVYAYTASAPLPENVDEYMLAGFLRKQRVNLVKCLTNDIYVPEDADFVIEGYVDTDEELRIEGPFGDHTGFYSLPDYYPVFHMTAITHKKDAVYPATIVGIPPQEDTWLGKATERIFLTPIRLTMLPEVVDMNLPKEGVFHNIAIVKIQNFYHGHAFKVMHALWGAGQMMFNKIMTVFPSSLDVNDYETLIKFLCTHADPAKDILLSKGPLDVLDHSAAVTGFGGKLGINACENRNLPLLSKEVKEKLLLELYSLCKHFSFVEKWNNSLIEKGLNILILFINDNSFKNIDELKKHILENNVFDNIRYVIFTESIISSDDLMSVVWRGANNFEPSRDADIRRNLASNHVLFIDACIKNFSEINNEKQWPNITTSDDKTIAIVDSKWREYGIGEFIPSPSLKFRNEKYKGNENVIF